MLRRTLPALSASLILLALAVLPVGSVPAQAPPASAAVPQLQPSPDPAAGISVPLGAPAITTEQGPLFPLRRVAARLGGQLTEGEGSTTLTLGETSVIAGPGNPVMIVGTEIVQLTQAPIAGASPGDGLLVPLDLLRASYGALQDYDFTWSPDERELTARRRLPRSLPVSVDVVHLQGVTTLVLQFPDRFAYEILERGDDVEVRPGRDRFEPPLSAPRVDDPLVHGVRVTPERVWIDLAPGTSAESYTLERPFRLVFDVVRAEEREAEIEEEPPDVEPPRDRPGLDTIVIDPGHGGTETGAIGPSGQQEKELTLELAQTLRARLRERLPVRVVLTREEDANLPHDTRTAIANQNKADLFVSIHLNSSLGSRAQGAETYFLSMEASDARAAEAAAAENRSTVGGVDEDPLYDLQLILWDLAQSHHLEESQRVASLIQEELNSALGLRNRGVKQAPFRVLMGAAMPAVLVELGFLSNPAEESRLRDPAYRAQLVDALVRAIGRYRSEIDEQAARERGEASGPSEPTP